MKNSQDLFNLIQTLTQSEKRYIKRYATMQGKGRTARYLALFDAIAGQKQCDDEALRQQFADSPIGKNYAEAKYYLYNVILKCLALHRSQTEPRVKTLRMLQYCQILIAKDLDEQAYKMCRKARKEEEKNLSVSLLKFIVELERWMKSELLRRPDRDAIQVEYEQNIRRYNEQEYQIKTLTTLQAKVTSISFLYGKPAAQNDKAYYRDLLNNPLLHDNVQYTNGHVVVLYHKIRGSCLYGLGFEQRALQESIDAVRIFQRDPRLCAHHPFGFISALYNVCVNAISMGRFTVYHEFANMHRKAVQRYCDGAGQKFITEASFIDAHYTACTGDFAESVGHIELVERLLSVFRGQLNHGQKTFFHLLAFHSYFGVGATRTALDHIRQAQEKLGRDDMAYFRRMAQQRLLIAHYDLEDYDLLEYLLDSTDKWYQRELTAEHPDMQILRLIKRALRARSATKRSDVFQEFRDSYAHWLAEHPERTHGCSAGDRFHLLAWLDTHITGKTYGVLVRELGWDRMRRSESAQKVP